MKVVLPGNAKSIRVVLVRMPRMREKEMILAEQFVDNYKERVELFRLTRFLSRGAYGRPYFFYRSADCLDRFRFFRSVTESIVPTSASRLIASVAAFFCSEDFSDVLLRHRESMRRA